MSEIKRRRLEEIEVECHRGTKVGEYVPFYFCPRSIMLYILCRGNNPGLTYTGGQRPVVHLVADLYDTIEWANGAGRRWAFRKGNAGAYYADFFAGIADLEVLNWAAISQRDWRDPDVKEGKQAEFLIETSFPWNLVERIGVIDPNVAGAVKTAISGAACQPPVIVERSWYY